MAKLYPPLIEGTLPAAYEGTIKIPFSMNQAVGWDEIQGFSIKIKSTSLDNKNIETCTYTLSPDEIEMQIALITFELNGEYTIGTFYKAQLAYIDMDGKVGIYSTVGVFKYSALPEIDINRNNQGFLGTYKNKNDSNEKLYSYNFILNKNNNFYATSGEIIYDNKSNPEILWNNTNFLLEGKYEIFFQTKSINGIEITISEIFTITQQPLQENDVEFITLKNDSENGIVNLQCKFSDAENYSYHFIKSNTPDQWKELNNFKFLAYEYELKYLIRDDLGYDYKTIQLQQKLEIGNEFDFEDDVFGPYTITKRKIVINLRDLNIEQGQQYKYGICYDIDSSNISQIFSIDILSDFEHCYLFDGERQLKIKYNPKISSLKDTILETKTNTIGSRYPFFYRNGNVKFKEFTISGLLSYLSDEEGLFDEKYKTTVQNNRDMTKSKQDVLLTTSTDLSAKNIKLEREFKLQVLDFLNSGKPMLFRSPTEGNYIIRLSNISLSPNDTLGRMIHSFSATATECAECNEENLAALGLMFKIEEV